MTNQQATLLQLQVWKQALNLKIFFAVENQTLNE